MTSTRALPPEGALGMVARGYTEASRCLRFTVEFYDGAGAGDACRTIGGYGAFDGETVAGVLDGFAWRVNRVQVGREYSPVVYVHTRGAGLDNGRRLRSDEVCAAFRALGPAAPDELTVSPAGVVRAWWD